MKNNSVKQLIWSSNKVLIHKQKLAQYFALFVALILVVMCVGALSSGHASLDGLLGIGGTFTCASIISFGTINGFPDNEYRTGKQVKSRLSFIEAEQYDDAQVFPSRVGRTIGNIPLKAGQYWNKINTVIDSPEIKWSGSMGDVAASIKNELTFTLAGMGDDIFNLLEKGVGKGFYIVFEICATGELFIAGNACKPVRMTKFDGGSDKDKTSTTVTWEVECGQVWSKYVGNTPTQAAAIVAADATSITLTSNPQYQLTNGATASAAIIGFTGVTDSDIDRVVTLLGSGGTHPSTIAPSTAILLVAGVSWTADAGKQISFRIKKYAATTTYTFVEVAGSRI